MSSPPSIYLIGASPLVESTLQFPRSVGQLQDEWSGDLVRANSVYESIFLIRNPDPHSSLIGHHFRIWNLRGTVPQ